MIRTIQLPVDVYAALWKQQRHGEEDEVQILRRILGVPQDQSTRPPANGPGGYRDPRYGVFFKKGFEIERTYLGQDFKARAEGGQWLDLASGKRCHSLNELSQAIGAKTENAWVNWFFIDDQGQRRSISELRDPSRIRKRIRRRK